MLSKEGTEDFFFKKLTVVTQPVSYNKITITVVKAHTEDGSFYLQLLWGN